MILTAYIAMDIPTALDVASTYAEVHDKTCRHDGNCEPMPWMVSVAFEIIRIAEVAHLIPCDVGVG